MSTVSVIIPVYNSEDTIQRCIESMISQTFSDISIIVINDGSLDKSGIICDDMAKKDPRITVIHQENQGVSAARNAGLDVATGEYICFCDSDDYFCDDFVEKMYNKIMEGYDVVTCTFFFNNVKTNDYNQTDILFNNLKLGKFFAKFYNIYQAPYEVTTQIYKRDIIENYSIRFIDYKKVFSEDTLFNLMYFAVSKNYARINTPLQYRFRHENSLMTTSVPGDYVRRHIYLIKEMDAFIIKNKLKINHSTETACLLWDFLRIACARSKGNVELLEKDFSQIEEKEFFKKKIKNLLFGFGGLKYCIYNSVGLRNSIHFHKMLFHLYKGNYGVVIRQYFT